MIVHAEDGHLLDEGALDGTHYAGFLASRPPAAEEAAIALVLAEAEATGGRAHIVHLSAAGAVPELHAARARGVDVSVETCPHYLTFDAEHIADGATELKCCPPIREAANREALWAALVNGAIDLVVSDHSPCTPDLKQRGGGDFGQAWGGIASVQLGLPAIWTGARERGVPLTDVVRWMASAPADRVGLTHKGRIEVGADADLVRFAPYEELTVDVTKLRHRNPVSAYTGRTLAGAVRETWLRGVTVDDTPRGRLLLTRPALTREPLRRSAHHSSRSSMLLQGLSLGASRTRTAGRSLSIRHGRVLRVIGQGIARRYAMIDAERRLHAVDADIVVHLLSCSPEPAVALDLRHAVGLSSGNLSHRLAGLRTRGVA